MQTRGPIYLAISTIRHHQQMTSHLLHKADIPVWESFPMESETSQIPWVKFWIFHEKLQITIIVLKQNILFSIKVLKISLSLDNDIVNIYVKRVLFSVFVIYFKPVNYDIYSRARLYNCKNIVWENECHWIYFYNLVKVWRGEVTPCIRIDFIKGPTWQSGQSG